MPTHRIHSPPGAWPGYSDGRGVLLEQYANDRVANAQAKPPPAPANADGSAEAAEAVTAARAAVSSLARAALSAAAKDDAAALRTALDGAAGCGLPGGVDLSAPWAFEPHRTGSGSAQAPRRTPAMVAALYGSLGCLELLLDAGAAASLASPDDGATALHCAAAGGSDRAVQCAASLLRHGADTRVPDRRGRRAADVIFELRAGEAGSAETATALQVMLGGQSAAAPMVPRRAPLRIPMSMPMPAAPLPPRRHSTDGMPARAHAAANGIGAAASGDLSDLDREGFQSDYFRMYQFKVQLCPKTRAHDWTECPFAHPSEKARRRDPRRFAYGGAACPDFRKGSCRRGDACDFAHGVFECWLHPSRYRTQLCKDGRACPRRVCFFAHSPSELRTPESVPLPPGRQTREGGGAQRSGSVSSRASSDGVNGVAHPSQMAVVAAAGGTGGSFTAAALSSTDSDGAFYPDPSDVRYARSWPKCTPTAPPPAAGAQKMLRVTSSDSLNGQDTGWVDNLVGGMGAMALLRDE